MRSTIVGMLLTAMLAALLFLVSTPAAPAGPVPVNDEPLAVRVREAIDKGKAFLRRQQKDGKWQDDNLLFANRRYQSGVVSLALLALLTCGATTDDQAVQEGLKFIRDVRPNMNGNRIAAADTSRTYSVSLETMVYGLAGRAEDKDRIQENVDWLLAARISGSGWTYGRADGGEYDASNTQYALLALHEGIRAGAKVDPDALASIQKFYRDTQQPDGSWIYAPDINPSMTMTTAGLCGLLITGMDREEGHRTLDKDGVDPNCGVYEENPKVVKAVRWIADRFPADPPNAEAAAKYFQTTTGGNNSPVTIQFAAPFYGLYGLERTGRLTGQRFLGGHDWYRVGCQCLVASQKDDGRWEGNGRGIDGNPLVATCFALLFLGKGRTPVLMTKLAYGQKDYEGWNNKHNDMRNVVEFAGRELFKKQPMAWQIFDIREKGAQNDKAIQDLTEQLLESPIVFFNGHDQVPDGNQVDLLKQYLDNGGFVFAEACCNDARFDAKFRALVPQLIPGGELKPLDPAHPIYSASGKFVSDPIRFPLYGVEQGCKTLLVYSPNAISGYWEANDTTSKDGKKAFETVANVIAYATGLEAPRQKLDSVAIAGKEPPAVKRGYLETAQLRYSGDWHPAPKAMHNLMTEARALGLDVALDSRATDDGIDPGDANIVRYRFLYMHGRGKFSYKPTELDNLRFDLEENGGLLLADACCGNKDFDASFRKFMEEFPWKDAKDRPKLEPIPPDDELFSEALNGKKIDKVMCRRESPDSKGVDTEFRSVTPALEGIKINGRWAVIYSRYDIGCALERHPTPGCLGHDFDSAAALGKAAVLYALKR